MDHSQKLDQFALCLETSWSESAHQQSQCFCLLCLLQVVDEVTGGLESWASKNRWEDLGIVQQVQQHKELQWVY